MLAEHARAIKYHDDTDDVSQIMFNYPEIQKGIEDKLEMRGVQLEQQVDLELEVQEVVMEAQPILEKEALREAR